MKPAPSATCPWPAIAEKKAPSNGIGIFRIRRRCRRVESERSSDVRPPGSRRSELAIASAFYRAVLEPLGIGLMEDHAAPDGTGWLVFSTGEPESPFFVVAAGRPSFWSDQHEAARSPSHFAFKASSRGTVDAFHSAGLAAGAKNNGDPGVRRGRYYCAFLIDPDSNNIEAGVYADP